MRRQQLREIISEGESFTVEFKRKFTSPEKISREIIAFANSGGGLLIVGVDDDKTIVGVESEKEEMELIHHACRFYIEPPLSPVIEIVNIEYKDVLVVHIPESAHKPHRLVTNNQDEKPYQRKAFIRQADKTMIASREMTKILEGQSIHAEPLRLSIGRHEKRLFEYLEEHERITVKEFADFANISERRAARLMVRLVRAGVLSIHTNERFDYYTLFG